MNPHYKGMGGLFGSEYWTYLLPRRVGAEQARALTERLLPLSARRAKSLGLVDDAFGADIAGFAAEVSHRAEAAAADPSLARALAEKRDARARDEGARPLAAYRADELRRMRACFFGEDRSFHVARGGFVRKARPAATPGHLAVHRSPRVTARHGVDDAAACLA
jgi:putative two-component system hydrogenase maturation factor HypX/HoxX